MKVRVINAKQIKTALKRTVGQINDGDEPRAQAFDQPPLPTTQKNKKKLKKNQSFQYQVLFFY